MRVFLHCCCRRYVTTASNHDCEKIRLSFDEVSLIIDDVIGIFYLYFITVGLAIVVVIVANLQMIWCPNKVSTSTTHS